MRTFRHYSEPFIIDESKLGRIDRIIREKFKTVSKEGDIQYTAILKSKKIISLPSFDSLLSMDNSLNDPVTSLEIEAETIVEGSDEIPEKNGSSNANKKFYHCAVNFGIQSDRALIFTTVQSRDITWTNSTLLALEEQIERTFQRGFWAKYRHSHMGFFLSMMLFLCLVFAVAEGVKMYKERYDLAGRMWLTENEVAQLLSKTDEISSPAEVYKLQLKNLQNYDQNGLSWKLLLSWKVSVILVLSIFVVIAFLYLIFWCYPMAVFNWGDMKEWYNNTCHKRKVVWESIVFAVILGSLVNIAASGIVGLFQ